MCWRNTLVSLLCHYIISIYTVSMKFDGLKQSYHLYGNWRGPYFGNKIHKTVYNNTNTCSISKLITLFSLSFCWKITGITLGGHILMLVISGILFAAGYDILPLRFEGLPLDIRDNDHFLRGLAWEERKNVSGYFDVCPLFFR